MKPSDIFNRAAEVMIERGHTKGDFFDDDGRVCLFGACGVAMGWESGDRMAEEPFTEIQDYLEAVAGPSPAIWNDRDETTEAMVIGVLHEAALLAKEAGQ